MKAFKVISQDHPPAVIHAETTQEAFNEYLEGHEAAKITAVFEESLQSYSREDMERAFDAGFARANEEWEVVEQGRDYQDDLRYSNFDSWIVNPKLNSFGNLGL